MIEGKSMTESRRPFKVTVTYLGAWSAKDAQEYRIEKIIGTPFVLVLSGMPDAYGHHDYKQMRVGQVITEAQASELAERAELTVLPNTK